MSAGLPTVGGLLRQGAIVTGESEQMILVGGIGYANELGTISIRGKIDSAKRLNFGFDETNDYGWIASLESLVASRPLLVKATRLAVSSQGNVSNALISADIASTSNNLLELDVGGTDLFAVNSAGKIILDSTVTPGGTTGNQTINKPTGTVNYVASGITLVVTNSLVTANSIVFTNVRTNDATAIIKNVIPSAGQFVIHLDAAATAETSIGFMVIN